MSTLLRSAVLSLTLALGCSPAEPARIPAGLTSPFTGYVSARYAKDTMWLCRPDLPSDPCRTDLTSTDIRADGTRVVLPDAHAKDPAVDCFYVYPTVDMGFFSRNHEDFADNTPIISATVAQVAHFTEACALYVPLYRQVSFGTYITLSPTRRDRFLAVAFSDIEDAFLHYMATYNHGRKVVLLGHSQGAEMVTRLLAKRFDGDPAMRERLIVAMAIGGRLEVPPGRTSGGTFANIPTCTLPDETGCVVGYRTHPAGESVSAGPAAPSAGRESVCVNPAGEGLRPFSRTIFPVTDELRSQLHGLEDVKTPFAEFRDYYAGQCVLGAGGYRYLEVREDARPGDVRQSPFDLHAGMFRTSLGLHILDYQFTQGDLIDLVKRKSAVH